MAEPKSTGTKAVVNLTMKNTFTNAVESARAAVFLMDDQGKVVGQAIGKHLGMFSEKVQHIGDQEGPIQNEFSGTGGQPLTASRELVVIVWPHESAFATRLDQFGKRGWGVGRSRRTSIKEPRRSRGRG